MINIQYMLTLTVHTSGLFLFQPSCNFTDSFQTCLNSHVLSCAKILEDRDKKKKKGILLAQQVKDLGLSLQRLRSLLWQGFGPGPGTSTGCRKQRKTNK